jgi:hypothetical protein
VKKKERKKKKNEGTRRKERSGCSKAEIQKGSRRAR